MLIYKNTPEIQAETKKWKSFRRDSIRAKIIQFGNTDYLTNLDVEPEWKTYKHYTYAQISDSINPLHLKHEVQIPGKPVVLGDGQTYIIPVLRDFPDGTLLPTQARIVDGGVSFVVKPDYLEICNIGTNIFEQYLSKDKLPPTAESISILTKLLQQNYAITEIDVLEHGLLSTDTVVKAMMTAVSFDIWVEFLMADDEGKKKLCQKSGMTLEATESFLQLFKPGSTDTAEQSETKS